MSFLDIYCTFRFKINKDFKFNSYPKNEHFNMNNNIFESR